MKAAFTRQGKIVVDSAGPDSRRWRSSRKTLACGICGSDLHALQYGHEMVRSQKETGGPLIYNADEDLVMGHEFCAEVVELGIGCLDNVQVGDIVCSMPVLLRPDRLHTIGYSNDFPGGYADTCFCLPLPALPVTNGLSPAEAAHGMMAVGRHAVEVYGVNQRCLSRDWLWTRGVRGGRILKQKGLGPIIAADFSPRRRELAELMGADEVIDHAIESPYRSWRDLSLP